MRCAEKYWNGYHQMTLKRPTAGIGADDLIILVNGFWMILASKIGEMRHSPALFGVMGLVSYSYTCICTDTNIFLITAGSGKTILALVFISP